MTTLHTHRSVAEIEAEISINRRLWAQALDYYLENAHALRIQLIAARKLANKGE